MWLTAVRTQSSVDGLTHADAPSGDTARSCRETQLLSGGRGSGLPAPQLSAHRALLRQRQTWAAQDLRPVAPGQHSPTKAPPVPGAPPPPGVPYWTRAPPIPGGSPGPRGLPQRRETSASAGLALSHIRRDRHLTAVWTLVPLPGNDQAAEVLGLEPRLCLHRVCDLCHN